MRGASKVFQAMYAGYDRSRCSTAAGRETFEAVSLLQSIQKTPYQPAAGATYPRGRFGDSMRQIAQLIKADVGVEVAFADIGGWDHHVNEVGPKASVGQLAERAHRVRQFSRRVLSGHGRSHGRCRAW